MNKVYNISKLFLVMLFICTTPNSADVQGSDTEQLSPNPIAMNDVILIHANNLALLTPPAVLDASTLSQRMINSDQLVQLNRPEHHSSYKTTGLDRMSTGLLADAGGLMEIASAPKINDETYPTPPGGANDFQPTDQTYVIDTPPSTTNSEWEQIVTIATSVPEPSTYLMFAGFLAVVALAKRRRTSVEKSL